MKALQMKWSQAGCWPVLWLTLAIILAGCGVQQLARGELQPPKVTFRSLKVHQPTGRGWPLTATLLLENPNSQPLNLLGYDYDLWLEGRSVAQGASQSPVNLPPRGQTVAEFPILVKLPAVLELLPRILQNQRQKLHYQLTGGFRLASVLGGLIRVPFSFQGQVTPQKGWEQLRPFWEPH
jgi:LEA14-like dessication related protein